MSLLDWNYQSFDNRNTPAYHAHGRLGRYMQHTIKDEGVHTTHPRIPSSTEPSDFTSTPSDLKVPVTPAATGTTVRQAGKGKKIGKGNLIADNTHYPVGATFKAPKGLAHKPLSKGYEVGYGHSRTADTTKLSSYRGTQYPNLIQNGGTNEFDLMSPEHKYRYEAYPIGTMTNDVTPGSNYERQIQAGVFPKTRAEEYMDIPQYGNFQPDTTSDRSFSNVYVSVGAKNSHMYKPKYRDIAAMPLQSGFIWGR